MAKRKKTEEVEKRDLWKEFREGFRKYFADFGTAVNKGDWGTRASLIVMGAGFMARKQYVKGIFKNGELIQTIDKGSYTISREANPVKNKNTGKTKRK